MLTWLSNNIGTIIVMAVVAAVVAAIIVSMRKSKKAGKSSCGCGCSSCPMSGECHSEKASQIKP